MSVYLLSAIWVINFKMLFLQKFDWLKLLKIFLHKYYFSCLHTYHHKCPEQTLLDLKSKIVLGGDFDLTARTLKIFIFVVFVDILQFSKRFLPERPKQEKKAKNMSHMFPLIIIGIFIRF